MIVTRLQEQTFGGLDRDSLRYLDSLADEALPHGAISNRARCWFVSTGASATPSQSMRDGFAWQDRTYSSLSAIARAITGTAWSGPRFFALRTAPAIAPAA